jgi:hypothetical protein
MLGDLDAFAASFLILGEVIAAGALAIAQFYVVERLTQVFNHVVIVNEKDFR